MARSLVIVESPAKAQAPSTSYLGKDYIVKSSVGHIRDLPVPVAKSLRSRKSVPRRLPKRASCRLPGREAAYKAATGS